MNKFILICTEPANLFPKKLFIFLINSKYMHEDKLEKFYFSMVDWVLRTDSRNKLLPAYVWLRLMKIALHNKVDIQSR